jgi:hypothetical protein
VVLGILQELKPLINESHERYLELQARTAKRRQEIKSAPPAAPATFKSEQERWKQEGRPQNRESQNTNAKNGDKEEPWDLLKQMEGIKFVSGRPQVSDAPVQRTKLEFKYPTISQQQQQQQQQQQERYSISLFY